MTWHETVGSFFNVVMHRSATSSRSVYKKIALYAVLGICVALGSYYGYRWYVVQREKAAQKVFAECVLKYRMAGEDATLWPEVQAMFTHGYTAHRSSNLAPYFLVYQADSMMQQGKFEDAVEHMRRAVVSMPSHAPVYHLYKTKYALMRFDLAGQEQEALSDLQALAYDTHNIYRDMALYYLGLYHWTHDNMQEAHHIWDDLLAVDSDRSSQSGWAALVHEKRADNA